MKKTRSADSCADRVDVITNFAVKMNAIIKRVHTAYIRYRWEGFETSLINNY